MSRGVDSGTRLTVAALLAKIKAAPLKMLQPPFVASSMDTKEMSTMCHLGVRDERTKDIVRVVSPPQDASATLRGFRYFIHAFTPRS
jgi:hypothetical protein